MNAQETFNKVAEHLLRQGRKALERDTPSYWGNNCRYRTPDGLACAVGCLIPDARAAQLDDEDNSASLVFLLDTNPDLNSILPTGEINRLPDDQVEWFSSGLDAVYGLGLPGLFLFNLQEIHDQTDVAKWPEYLRLFAKTYNLSLPPILQPQS